MNDFITGYLQGIESVKNRIIHTGTNIVTIEQLDKMKNDVILLHTQLKTLMDKK